MTEHFSDDELLAEVEQRGYRLAVQCHRCRHWLVSDESTRDHLGPVCRARQGVVA